MKNLTRFTSFIALAVIIAFVFVSCNDLTENVHDEVTEENFNPTAKDLPNIIAPIYSEFRFWMQCCDSFVSLEEGAGDGFITPARPHGWGADNLPFHYHQWSSNHEDVKAIYSQLYDIVNASNRVLHQIESDIVPVPDENRESLVAEIKVIRAFAYYQLMDNYGSVPIVTDFTAGEAPEQSTRQEVYDFVVQELTDNIPNLVESTNLIPSRITRWAGLATLARVYLNAEVYTGTPRYDEVISVTDQIIDSGIFQLESNYKNNFTRDNQNSVEVIWSIPYDEVFAPENTMHMRSLAPEQQQQFQMTGQPWGGSSATPQFIDVYDEEDKRLEQTWFGGPQTNPEGDTVVTLTKNVPSMEENTYANGYRIKKYEIYQNMQRGSDVDFPLFRYSMVLMMKAEALLRTGSPNQAANIVTRVRERAFDDPSEAQVTGTELQMGSEFPYGYWENGQVVDTYGGYGGDDIENGRFLDELAREFAWEGFRRQDLIRFGVFSRKSWFNKKPSDPCKQVFPIPLPALERNSNLEQHPCYQ
jgi:hypothetical protein